MRSGHCTRGPKFLGDESSLSVLRVPYLLIGFSVFILIIAGQKPLQALIPQIDQEEIYIDRLAPLSENAEKSNLVGRASLKVRRALRDLNQPFSPCIVQITGSHGRKILGTIVTSDGLILTKASELDPEIHCELADSTRHAGKLVAINRQNDLALIRIAADGLMPIKLNALPSFPATGDLVTSFGPSDEPLGLGIVCVPHRSLPIKQPVVSRQSLAGIKTSAQVISKTIVKDNKYIQKLGLQVVRVEPRSIGEQANLLVDDLICSINGKPTIGMSSWDEALQSLAIGHKATFEIIRNDRHFETSLTIKNLSRTIHDRWGAGPYSMRRFELGAVIIHDTPLSPEECGAPLVNLDGEVVGINIARSLRSATLAIPTQTLLQWIRSVQPNAKLHLARQTDKNAQQ
jgi:serine protease Do